MKLTPGIWKKGNRGGRGLVKTRGTMNGMEKRYADYLYTLQLAGEVLWYKFEGMKFRLADGAFYTPDFAVMLADCSIEFHETKGLWEEAARVRIKVASETFPFKFKAITRGKAGAWEVEEL